MMVALRAFGPSFVAVTIAVVAVGWAAAAGADMVHDRACSRLERRIEAGSRRRLDKCAQTAANREARGRAFDAGACEAKERARSAARRAACGCPTDAIDESRFHGAGVPGRGPIVVNGEAQARAYEIVDGEAILEGDIILGPVDTDGLVIALLDADGEDRPGVVTARSATGPDFGWTGNTIPYELDPALDAMMRDRIFTARDHWNANTIVRLRPRRTERDFVRFTTAAENCWSRSPA